MAMYSDEQEERVREAIRTEIRKRYRNQSHFAVEHGLHKGWLGEFLSARTNRGLTRQYLERVAEALGVDPDELIMERRQRRVQPEPEPQPESMIEERITDGDEIKLIYLARGWGVAKALMAIQLAKANEDRQTKLTGEPTVAEIRKARKDDKSKRNGHQNG